MRLFRTLVMMSAISCFVAPLSFGQAETQEPATAPIDCQTALTQARAGQGAKHNALEDIEWFLDATKTPACVVKLLTYRSTTHLLNRLALAEYKSATSGAEQNGSSSGSGGSTNLVSKGLTSRVLSFASEYGALTESSSGQTTTVSGRLDGIPLALAAHSRDLIAECPFNLVTRYCIPGWVMNGLDRVSYSVAFNTIQAPQLTGTATGPTQGTAQPVSFKSTGSAATVSQITGKVVILQTVDFSKFAKDVNNIDQKEKSDSTKDLEDLVKFSGELVGYQSNANRNSAWRNWAVKTATALQDKNLSDEEAYRKWLQQGDSLAEVLEHSGDTKKRPTDDMLMETALNYAAAYGALASAEQTFFETNALKPLITFEYDENRPNSQPTNSVLRLIFGFGGGQLNYVPSGRHKLCQAEAADRRLDAYRELRGVHLRLHALKLDSRRTETT